MFIGSWEIELHIKHSAYLVRNYSDLVTTLSPRCNLVSLAWCGLQKPAAQSIRYNETKMTSGNGGHLVQRKWDLLLGHGKLIGSRPSVLTMHLQAIGILLQLPHSKQAHSCMESWISSTALGHLDKRAVFLTQCPGCPMVHLPLVSQFCNGVIIREMQQGSCRKIYFHQGEAMRGRGCLKTFRTMDMEKSIYPCQIS